MILIKYLEIGDVVWKLLRLNRKLRSIVQSENYLLFKHFLRNFNLLNDRLKRADIPAKIAIMTLLRDNFSLRSIEHLPGILLPFCYYTDGGAYNDESKYFIHNIFSRSNVCYSSKIPKCAHVQAYLGR